MRSPGRKIFITGAPGCGKTTLIKELFTRFPDLCGFWTEEVRKRGIRTGFQIVTTWGERLPLSSVNSPSPFRVGKYGVEVQNITKVCQKVRECRRSGKKRFILDEIGKMEYFSSNFRQMIWEILEDPESEIFATISLKDFHPEIRTIKEMGEVFHLERGNFEQILRALCEQ
ncbi:MAG: AAA family ATPase [Caldiserica bacterium]|jgi:nucleoside-triphosphatase|nr:AAA family ATPase [Caldisericota bacterium]MDH7562386.1 nucleoside-triphosphatase [Caldisericota bacterium]